MINNNYISKEEFLKLLKDLNIQKSLTVNLTSEGFLAFKIPQEFTKLIEQHINYLEQIPRYKKQIKEKGILAEYVNEDNTLYIGAIIIY